MRDETVARTYAETLFELARRHNAAGAYGEGLEAVAKFIGDDPSVRAFLETPRIDDRVRKRAVRHAFGGGLPEHVVNFVLVAVDKRRQRLLREMSRIYGELLDAHEGRERVEVTLARPANDSVLRMIAVRLSALRGKNVIPRVRVRPEILGGVIVRTSDAVYDGSVRRRLGEMRRSLMRARLGRAPAEASGGAAQSTTHRK